MRELYWLKLYGRFQVANLRSRAVYPVNFAVGITGIVASGFVSLLLLWVVMSRTPDVNGWSFGQLVFMASLWRICHGLFIVLFQQVWDIDSHVRQGTFDRYLVRPAGLLFQYSTMKVQIAGIGELITGIGGLIWSGTQVVQWSVFHMGWLLVVIVSGVTIEWSIFLAVGAVSFWTQKSEALRDIIGSFLLQFTNYPLTAYGPTLRFILTFILPFGFMHFYPSQVFMSDIEPPSTLIYMAPLVAALTCSAAYAFWRLAIRSYQGVGS